MDNFTRESLAIEVEVSMGGQQVVEVLGLLGQEQGLPKIIRVGRNLPLSAWVSGPI